MLCIFPWPSACHRVLRQPSSRSAQSLDETFAGLACCRLQHVLYESRQEMFDRLGRQDMAQQDAGRAALATQYYGQFPFAPSINPTSRKMGQVRPLSWLLLSMQKGAA